jgi:hypothetical protein
VRPHHHGGGGDTSDAVLGKRRDAAQAQQHTRRLAHCGHITRVRPARGSLPTSAQAENENELPFR